MQLSPRTFIREGTTDDIEQIVDLGMLFFEESNFRTLNYDPVRLEELLHKTVPTGELIIDVAEDENGRIVGYCIWGPERHYTVELMASLFLFYVYPPYRKSAIARDLMETSVERARDLGAAVFYAASTAGISTQVDGKMENMLEKLGFDLLGKFARKVLA